MSKTLSHKPQGKNKIYTKILTITKHLFRPFFLEEMCMTLHKRFRVVKLGLVQSK